MYKKDENLRFDLSPHSPHTIVFGLLQKESTILDVGCNVGYFGERCINRKKCIVDGIDINKSFLREAKLRGYRQTFSMDLSQENFQHIHSMYDYVLFIDILEHLSHPDKVLRRFVKENLKQNSIVVISLPNIARVEIRLRLLLGKFDYTFSGIIHQDHLRHFTLKSGRELIKESGLQIKQIIPTGFGHRLQMLPTLTAFQFIFVCKKK